MSRDFTHVRRQRSRRLRRCEDCGTWIDKGRLYCRASARIGELFPDIQTLILCLRCGFKLEIMKERTKMQRRRREWGIK